MDDNGAQRKTHRLQIKRTVERAVPMMDIDSTMVLTDEEIEELHRQTDQRRKAVQLAKVGRAALRARLKKTVLALDEEETTGPSPSS